MERSLVIEDPVGDAVQKVIDDTRRAGRPWALAMFVATLLTTFAYIALMVWYWRTPQAELWLLLLGFVVLRRVARTVSYICIRRLERITGVAQRSFFDTLHVVGWGMELGMLCFVIWLALK